jgi:hypothetical protein
MFKFPLCYFTPPAGRGKAPAPPAFASRMRIAPRAGNENLKKMKTKNKIVGDSKTKTPVI